MSTPYKDALRLIEQDRMPCHECGKPHEPRPHKKYYVTWADPDDGHSYQRMSAAEYAREILNGGER